jgi:hypothetical protein
MRWCSPGSNGNETVPRILLEGLGAICSFQRPLEFLPGIGSPGKKAWQMWKVMPS